MLCCAESFSHSAKCCVRLFVIAWTISPPGSSVHGNLQARTLYWLHALLQGIFPTQGLNPCIAGDSLPSEPPGRLKNTRVGSLSLLQGISVTQELNRGLLHIRQILYQLNYQGSLLVTISAGKTNF